MPLRFLALVAAAGLFGAAMAQSSGRVLRVESMPEWQLEHKVEPDYPEVAVERRIQGVVRFSVTIGEDGRIERLALISGHPLLVAAARRAVRQWVYRPTMLRGKPVRVITQITVPFELDAYGRPSKRRGASRAAL